MVRCTTCSCVLHFLTRAEFVLTTGENLLCQRARLVYWAQSPSCHSTVVACSVGKAEPRKCSGSCSLPSSLGSALISKSPAIECKAGWLAWCKHGPYHWGLGLFPAQGEAQIVFIPWNGQLSSFCSSTLPYLWVLVMWGCLTFQKHC